MTMPQDTPPHQKRAEWRSGCVSRPASDKANCLHRAAGVDHGDLDGHRVGKRLIAQRHNVIGSKVKSVNSSLPRVKLAVQEQNIITRLSGALSPAADKSA